MEGVLLSFVCSGTTEGMRLYVVGIGYRIVERVHFIDILSRPPPLLYTFLLCVYRCKLTSLPVFKGKGVRDDITSLTHILYLMF